MLLCIEITRNTTCVVSQDSIPEAWGRLGRMSVLRFSYARSWLSLPTSIFLATPHASPVGRML